jgi:hypothetical protein
MGLALLTLLVMAVVAYAHWREGLLTAFAMTCNVLAAGLLAFNFYEPVAAELEPAFAGSFLEGYEDALSLFVLFALPLVGLRYLTNSLAYTELDYHPLAQQVGAVLCALVTGYLVAGFLACLLQTLPLPERFLGFDPQAEPGLRRRLPPDRVWLAMMHRAGAGPFANGDNPTFDPDGSFELRYARLRRYRD